MTKKIVLIDDIKDAIQIQDYMDSHTKIYALNFIVHKKLDEENIEHEIADKILNKNDRDLVFKTTTKFHKWFLNQTFSKDFSLFGVNILGMFDKAEMHSYLIHKILQFNIIKKIIEKENPENIIISSNLKEITQEVISIKKIKLIILKKQIEKKFEYDNYSFIVNIGSKPISLTLSRKQYSLIKNIMNEISSRIFNFCYKPRKNKKTILLLEFNPIQVKSLIEKLSKDNFEVVMFNLRRPAAWNLESLKILKKNNVKIVNPKSLINNKIKNNVDEFEKIFTKKLESLWKNENKMKRIFPLGEFSLWPIIKNNFIQIYNDRLGGYLNLIISSKILFEKSNIECVLCLNAVGETETAVLNVESNKSSSILIEHGFTNYTKDTAKYDSLSYYHFIKDKIAVWGNIQKEYLVSNKIVQEEQILVTGSPKHDSFFHKQKKLKSKNKKILLTLHPINEYSGNGDIETYIRFERMVKKICEIIKKTPNIELSVKLHPGHSETDDYVKNLFQKNLKDVKILQITPIEDLLDRTNILINLTPEAADPSTVLLESMILEIPIVEISLDDYKYDFEYLKDHSVLELSEKNNIESELSEFLTNEKMQKKLIQNGKKHVEHYLVNRGTASEKILEIIKKMTD